MMYLTLFGMGFAFYLAVAWGIQLVFQALFGVEIPLWHIMLALLVAVCVLLLVLGVTG